MPPPIKRTSTSDTDTDDTGHIAEYEFNSYQSQGFTI
jgi:hypothetical protein